MLEDLTCSITQTPNCGKGKGTVQWNNRGIALFILNLGTRWRGVNFMPWPLYPCGKCPQYILNRMLDGLRQSVDGSKKNRISCQESNLRFLGHPSHSLVSTLNVPSVVELTEFCIC
jgi:hypothetical protein